MATGLLACRNMDVIVRRTISPTTLKALNSTARGRPEFRATLGTRSQQRPNPESGCTELVASIALLLFPV